MPRDISLELDDRSAALRRGLYCALEAAVLDCVASCGDALVVDAGTGRGELLARLSKLSLNCLGIDPEPECVVAASRCGECLPGGINDLPQLLAGRSPDVIVCSHVLEHLDAPLAAVQSMKRTGAKHLVLAVPNVHRSSRLLRVMSGRRCADHPAHLYAWGHAEFEAMIRRAGYVVEQWYVDRVTVNPFSGKLGTKLAMGLRGLEETAMARLHPTLASSLIARCRLEE